jgi:perosamine synthetase
MDEVIEFAKKHKLKVVEDAAQAVGVNWNGKQAGTFGDIGSFSFFADKTLTTGEGGLVVTNNEELYNKLLYIRNQGRLNRGSFIHPEIGYNFIMNDLQTSIGLVQLEKFPEIIQKKAEILSTYKKYLNPKLRIIEPNPNSSHIPFRVCILIPGGSQKLMEYMDENEIETRTFFYPLNKQPCYEEKSFWKIFKKKTNFDVSEKMYNEGVCLPSWVGISEEDIKYICDKINEFKL